MSTPTEKALEIANKMYYGSVFEKTKAEHLQEMIRAKEVALFAVDEILAEVPTEILDTYKGETHFIINDRYLFWQEVKQEIEKL
jgi:hypothetical protein